jgi:hypothetical protein
MPLATEGTEIEPVDVPEGTVLVLVSGTLLKQWADEKGWTLDWGKPRPWSGWIYEPVVKENQDGG